MEIKYIIKQTIITGNTIKVAGRTWREQIGFVPT